VRFERCIVEASGIVSCITGFYPEAGARDLLELADGKVPALLCFEHPTSPAWYHRGIASARLQVEVGLDVPEYGREQDGCGVDHPKLCEEARAFLPRHVASR
jgi:hypothetical protein